MSAWKDIGTLLLEYGLITESDLEEGMRHHEKTGLRLGEALAGLGKVTMEDIDYVLSKQLDIPFIIVDDINVNSDLLAKFDKSFLINNKVLPLHVSDDQITIAIEDPFNRNAIDTVSDIIRKKVNISTGNGEKIEELLRKSFDKVGIPDLVASIKEIIEKIRDTSFYRIDFILNENNCTINIFGAGILKELMKITGSFSKEDVFSSFDSLDIPILYDVILSESSAFLAIYPLTNRMPMTGYPAIVSCYGLLLPEGISFTDATIYRMSDFLHSSIPQMGYPFLSTKTGRPGHDLAIYTIDAMPKEPAEYHVHAYIPDTCTACNGQGCSACRDLGYEFNKMEGTYSADEMRKWMKER